MVHDKAILPHYLFISSGSEYVCVWVFIWLHLLSGCLQDLPVCVCVFVRVYIRTLPTHSFLPLHISGHRMRPSSPRAYPTWFMTFGFLCRPSTTLTSYGALTWTSSLFGSSSSTCLSTESVVTAHFFTYTKPSLS